MLTVLHAYSNSNAGDGLLVRLTRELVHEAAPDRRTRFVALDAASFQSGDVEPFDLRPRFMTPAKSAGGSVRSIVCSSTGVIAVGGGYLRADGAASAAKTSLAHVTQLSLAARSGLPAVYLPQSIGPLPAPMFGYVRRCLSAVNAVHVRDGRSLSELSSVPTVRRTPDLAVLELARNWQAWTTDIEGPVVIVARALPNAGPYVERLVALRRLLPDALWAVQSDGRGNRDQDFYRTLGVQPAGRLQEVLDAHPTGVVVSVRLHGALQALMRGWPSVHLSYERKGWGAYGDLGISPFVHSARSFDPPAVAEQVRALREDPRTMGSAIQERIPHLVGERQELVRQIRDLMGAGA